MNFKARVKENFNTAAARYDAHASLQMKAVRDLAKHLPKINPSRVLDIGTGTGYGVSLLKQAYPKVELFALDFAEAMLKQARSNHDAHYLAADFDHLPFVKAAFDCVFSSLSFQWSHDLLRSLQETSRVLNKGGYLLFSTLVNGTLKEIKKTNFLKSNEVLDALNTLDLEILDVSCVREQLYFSSPRLALLSLKKVGAHASWSEASYPLNLLLKQYPKEDQGYPLTYEVMYVLARKNK